MDFINNYSVSVFNLKGEFIQEWPSVAKAAKALGIPYTGNIQMCLVGKRNTAAGYIWKYSPSKVTLLQGEEWKPVVGFEHLYAVSNKGRVASLQYHGKPSFSIMSQSNCKGYKVVKIRVTKTKYASSLRVHRLVAKAFLPNPDNKPDVDHINTDITNNNVENLRWVTSVENQNNSITLKRIQKNIISYNKSSEHKELMRERLSKPVYQYTQDGIFIAEFSSMKAAALKLNTTTTCIKRVCDGERKHYKHFIFKYK